VYANLDFIRMMLFRMMSSAVLSALAARYQPLCEPISEACVVQKEAFKRHVVSLCKEDAQTTVHGGCEAEAESLLQGDPEIWSRGLLNCPETSSFQVLWAGFSPEQRVKGFSSLRKAGGCILHGPTGMEDTRLAMLLNKPDVGTLKNCSWPETQGFWEGASRQFALNFVGQRKKPNPIGPDVLLVTSYFFQSAVSPTETADDLLSQDMINQDKAFSTWKAIFDTVLYSVELKALAMSLRENMTVRIVSTHPNMTRPLVASWTVIVQERVRLLRPAAKPDAPSGLKWQFAFGCELQSLLQCESQAFGEAAEGEVSAANNLGLMYSKGLGMGRDYKQALKWFERAAEYSTVAQDHLGTLFLFGRGMEHPDHRKAFQWFRKAAASDYPLAQYHLGVMFRNDGDLQNAIAFFFKAAEKGLPAAESEVASYYAQVRKDDKTALQWYKKAAAGNNVDAQHHLGIMFYYGRAMRHRDVDEARRWWFKAAEQGYDLSQFALGRMFYDQHDYGQARKWFEAAAGQGHKEAKKWLQRLPKN